MNGKDIKPEEDSEGQGQAVGGASPMSFGGVSTDTDGKPTAVNILKPQIDLIFSEVQKNLPTIDFDSVSDVSISYFTVTNSFISFTTIN